MAAAVHRKRSLKQTLIFSVIMVHIVIFLLTLVINFTILFWSSQRQLIAESQNNLAYMNHQLDNLFANLSDIRSMLLQDANVMEYLHTPQGSDPADILLQVSASGQLSQLVQSYAYLDSIVLFQWNGDSLSVSKKNVSQNQKSLGLLPVQESEVFTALSPSSPISWGGVYGRDSFFPNLPLQNRSSSQTISFLIPLVNIWHPNRPAVVAVNIPVSYFDFLYSKTAAEGSSIYLYDQHGAFLFRSGNVSPHEAAFAYGNMIQGNADFGHFDTIVEKEKCKIIYNRNSHTGWYVVEEVPFPVLLRNMMYLQTTMGLTFLVAVLLIICICVIILRKLLGSLEEISEQLSPIGKETLQKRLPEARYSELNPFVLRFNSMMDRIEHLMTQKIADEREKRELEVAVLQSQINPHFLYNSLTTIRWMASIARVSNVCEALLALNNVLRPVFSNSGVLWKLKEEQAFLENFIAIMNYRFGNNIRCVYDIPEELSCVEVLRFLLQPVVENCIIHGLRGKADGLISIKAFPKNQTLTLTVSDNGCSIPPAQLEQLRAGMNAGSASFKNGNTASGGFGLYNINRRIRLQYGESYGLEIVSEAGFGTEVTVRVPISYRE